MAERKEPTLSGIRPERDEIRSNTAKVKRPAGGASRQAPRPSPRVNNASSPLALIALIVALLGVGTGGFSFWKLQQSEVARTDAERRIAELEGRLNLTSDESSQSVTAIHEKLDWADSEIRKLWGVSNDKNKKSIQANTRKLTAINKLAKSAADDAKKAKASSDSQKSILASVRTQTNEQQLLLTRVSESSSDSRQQLRDVDALAKQLEIKVTRLETSLVSRVGSNEEAIKAIDAFRRSANSDIQQLKQRLGTP